MYTRSPSPVQTTNFHPVCTPEALLQYEIGQLVGLPFPHPSHRAQKHPPTHISRLIHHIGKGESKNMGCFLLSGDKKLSKRKNRGAVYSGDGAQIGPICARTGEKSHSVRRKAVFAHGLGKNRIRCAGKPFLRTNLQKNAFGAQESRFCARTVATMDWGLQWQCAINHNLYYNII